MCSKGEGAPRSAIEGYTEMEEGTSSDKKKEIDNLTERVYALWSNSRTKGNRTHRGREDCGGRTMRFRRKKT